MSFFRRLLNIEKGIELHSELFPPMPEFEKWTDEHLDKYNRDATLEFHKQNAIKNYGEAIALLKMYDKKGLITKQELKLFMEDEKEFWEKNA